MTLDDLIGLGGYLSCGYVDLYDGRKHHRLAEVSRDMKVALLPGAAAVLDELIVKESIAVLTATPDNAPKADKAEAKAKKKVEPK